MTNLERIQMALEHWGKRFRAKPDWIAIDPGDSHVLWLCADFYRQQVVLDKPISHEQVDQALRKVLRESVLSPAVA
jgi:hypothetical protein